MRTFTYIFSEQQKNLIAEALTMYAQLQVGQRGGDQLAAKKLEPHVTKAKDFGTNNLSELDLSSNKY